VIRLAISCDICGAEKKQANHWFVAYEHAGELRVSGWKSRHCKRAGSRHLCGQACLHKLVDEFMAQSIAEDRGIAAAELTSLAQASPQPQIAPVAEPMRSEPAPPQAPLTETQKYASHQWRSTAWERERKRESFGR
jgi:hypothetical protein